MYESKGKASPILYSYLVDGVTISINRYHVGAVGLFGGSTMNKIKYHGGIGSLNVPLSIEHYVSPGRLLLGSSWLLFFKVNKTKKKRLSSFLAKANYEKKSHFPTWKIPFDSRTLLCFHPFTSQMGRVLLIIAYQPSNHLRGKVHWWPRRLSTDCIKYGRSFWGLKREACTLSNGHHHHH